MPSILFKACELANTQAGSPTDLDRTSWLLAQIPSYINFRGQIRRLVLHVNVLGYDAAIGHVCMTSSSSLLSFACFLLHFLLGKVQITAVLIIQAIPMDYNLLGFWDFGLLFWGGFLF